MCSMCNYKSYDTVDGRLEQGLGMGNVVIRCDVNGRN